MGNIADAIEEYILRRLTEERGRIVLLRRNDMAEEIECAPSQISYVLSTRFTADRGFAVESRRGLGGYIRIERTTGARDVYREMAGRINEATQFADMERMIRYLAGRKMLKDREAALALQFAACVCGRLPPAERTSYLRSIFLTLADD